MWFMLYWFLGIISITLIVYSELAREQRKKAHKPDYKRIYELEVELGMREEASGSQIAETQYNHSLQIDGIVGHETAKALVDDWCTIGWPHV